MTSSSPFPISVLSIPGLPNGVFPLDSTLYHNYKPSLGVISKVVTEKKGPISVFFQSYIWPREVRHPLGNWTRFLPLLCVPIYYYAYLWSSKFRTAILKGAATKLEACLKTGDTVFLILHSHGNRIGIDAILELHRKNKIPRSKKIYVISLAPAYSHVGYGLIRNSLSQKTIEEFVAATSGVLMFRVASDPLSGKPPLPQTDGKIQGKPFAFRLFSPRFFEYGLWGHETVRWRKDVMEEMEKLLGEILKG